MSNETTETKPNTDVGGLVEPLVILPDSRVEAYDTRAEQFKTGTVVRRYGFISEYMERLFGRDAAKYPDCIDVIFDYDGRTSKGHFANSVRAI